MPNNNDNNGDNFSFPAEDGFDFPGNDEPEDLEEWAEGPPNTELGQAIDDAAGNQADVTRYINALDVYVQGIAEGKIEVNDVMEDLENANEEHRDNFLRYVNASTRYLEKAGEELYEHGQDLLDEANALFEIAEEAEVTEWSTSEEEALKRYEGTAYGAFNGDE